MNTAPHMSALEWGFLFLLSILWGGSFFLGKVALADFGPFTIVLGRVAIGSLTLLFIARLMGKTLPRDINLWRDFAIMGIINNVLPFSLIFWGEQEMASGLAATLNATTPVFGILVGKLFNPKTAISSRQVEGIILGVLGVVVIVGPVAFHNFGQSMASEAAILCAAISYSFAGHFGRRFRHLPPIVPAAGQVTCSVFIMAPIALLLEKPWLNTSPAISSVLAIVALGVFSTGLAYLIFFRLLTSVSPVNIMLVAILMPASSIILGFLFLSEQLSLGDFAGLGLIAFALLTIDGRILEWLNRVSLSNARLGERDLPYLPSPSLLGR